MASKTKNISIILLIIIFILLYIFIYLPNSWNSRSDIETGWENSYDISWNQNITEEELDLQKAKERMQTLKKKLELKWLIATWDLYLENEQYTVALTKYLQVYREIPSDQEINLKLWDIYYALNKFSKANTYYEKIKSYPSLNKSKAVVSYLNANKASSLTISEINEEINSFELNSEESFYYKNWAICVFDFSECRKNFQDYFAEHDRKVAAWEEIKDYSADLENVKEAFENYYNFQIDDLTYKWALITWAFYENGFYAAALWTAQEILAENPDYKPILKIAAKSAYELWDYISAKSFLIKYNKIQTNDSEASYFLWRVYEKLNEHLLSTIHFNKAIKIGYKDLTDVRRRLIFLYFELENNKKMLSTFKELIDSNSPDLDINDYNLAIYYHIINDDFETSLKYSELAKTKYPDSELFYWYYAWISLQDTEIDEIKETIIENNIDKWLEINPKNPMIIMTKWMYEFHKEDYKDAIKTFEDALDNDESWEYRETLNYWIEKVETAKNNK